MAQISKVDALIQIADAIINDDKNRVKQMSRIFEREISKEARDFKYESAFELTRDEKKVFVR